MVHSLFGGITGYNFQKYCILSLMIDFVLDPDKMPRYVVFYLGLQFFQKCPFRGPSLQRV